MTIVVRRVAPSHFFLISTLAASVPACASVAPPSASEPIAGDGSAAAVHGKRYLEYRVGTHVAAPPERVWALLTDAQRYPQWNSTVISIEGSIAAGERIALTSKIDPKRTFDLTVSTFLPHRKLVWQDGGKAFKGVRTFTLSERPDGTTDFTMAEVLTGMFLPAVEKKLPDFRPSFTEFAADLKRAAEARAVP